VSCGLPIILRVLFYDFFEGLISYPPSPLRDPPEGSGSLCLQGVSGPVKVQLKGEAWRMGLPRSDGFWARR